MQVNEFTFSPRASAGGPRGAAAPSAGFEQVSALGGEVGIVRTDPEVPTAATGATPIERLGQQRLQSRTRREYVTCDHFILLLPVPAVPLLRQQCSAAALRAAAEDLVPAGFGRGLKRLHVRDVAHQLLVGCEKCLLRTAEGLDAAAFSVQYQSLAHKLSSAA